MITILAFVRHYLPGYKYGGPLQSVSNLVAMLGNEFHFRIVTSDRDLHDTITYPGITMDAWNRQGRADVFYCSPARRSLAVFRRLITHTAHDVLYLNSFFDPVFTVLPLLLRRLRLVPTQPLVLAPRGEFSQSALALKAWKKRPYVRLALYLGLYRRLIWQASGEGEAQQICEAMGSKSRIKIAENIVVAPDLSGLSVTSNQNDPNPRVPGTLRILFLSRISPMKNLDGALRSLAKVRIKIKFNIYGPIGDEAYWKSCQLLIQLLPGNISAQYLGSIRHFEVTHVMARHDLLFLPSHGENFGHVILESLAAGTPVLISDKTPWRNLNECGVGWIRPVNDFEAFAAVIELLAAADDKSWDCIRRRARQYALEYVQNDNAVERSRKLFRTASSGVTY